MDKDQFKLFLEHQTNVFTQLMNTVSASLRNAPGQSGSSVPAQAQASVSSVPVPQPSPLSVEGDMSENFEFFERSWENYSKAIGMDKWPATENSKKVSFLMAIIGEPARKKFFNFELTAEQQENPEAALAAIKLMVVPNRNVIVDRLDFFSAVQSSGESIDDFNSRLKVLAKVAKLGALEKELLVYKIVTANKWPQLRTKMLTITDITLEKAIDLCRAEEIAARRSQELEICSEVYKVTKVKGASWQSSLRCKFCGDSHEFVKGVCPALGKRCHRCKGKNHFEKVCRAARKSKRVKQVRECSDSDGASQSGSESSSEEECEIGKIYDGSSNDGSVLAEVRLKFGDSWKKVSCELDTGANTSLIGHDTLMKLSGVQGFQLLPSKFRLQSFGGNPINVLGQVKLPCRRSGRKFLLVLQVVDVDHRPLLSARASRELGLIKFCDTVSVGKLESYNQTAESDRLLNVYRVEARRLVGDHQELLTGCGRLPGTDSLELDEGVKPSGQFPRRVSVAMVAIREFVTGREEVMVPLSNLEPRDECRKEKARKLPELEVQAHSDYSKLWTPGMTTNRYDKVRPVDDRRSLVHHKPRKESDTSSSRRSSGFPPEIGRNGVSTSLNEECNQAFPSCQTDQLITESSPAVASPITPLSLKVNRPKRPTRVPEKLKDFHLMF